MPTPAGTLSDLARLLLLIRDQPDRGEEISDAVRRLIAGFTEGAHVLRVMPTGFTWDRITIPLDRGEVSTLHFQLRAHGVAEVQLPDPVTPQALLILLTLLAATPAPGQPAAALAARLEGAGCGAIGVVAASEPEPPEAPNPDGPGGGGAGGVAPPGVSERIAGPGVITGGVVGMMHFLAGPTEASSAAEDLLARLMEPMADDQGFDLLNEIVLAGEARARAGEWAGLLEIVSRLVEVEASGVRVGGQRGIGIALRRLLPRPSLAALVPFTARGGRRAAAVAVLRRMDVDGTEVLVTALSEAEEVEVRRAYFTALKEVAEGNDLLVNMLTHDQWYVVRNVALLCGELRMESAIPALARLVEYEDERVRRAVAGALARIGGTGTADPLRRALRDPSSQVRHDLARELDGQRNRNLAMSLAVAAEQEEDFEVRQQMYLALGRMASPEAIQALRQAAEPGGKLLGRKPQAIRLAAVAGLHAAGPSGVQGLRDLAEDGDAKVREAVKTALKTLWG